MSLLDIHSSIHKIRQPLLNSGTLGPTPEKVRGFFT
jgi:hypothetical protein